MKRRSPHAGADRRDLCRRRTNVCHCYPPLGRAESTQCWAPIVHLSDKFGVRRCAYTISRPLTGPHSTGTPLRRYLCSERRSSVRVHMGRRSPMGNSIWALEGKSQISARTARTENVRIEFLRCRSRATLQWRVARSHISLMWARDKGSNARMTMAGQATDSIAPGRAKFWFFPEGAGAEGELTGRGAYDFVGLFVKPSFLSVTVKQTLAEPIAGFSHEALGRAFDEMAGELTTADELLPIFTEGWAMQALAYVARAAMEPQPRRATTGSGLAPWQLRRAKEIFLADLSERPPMDLVAAACKLSISHFARAFKASTGAPPHQWLMTARIERARVLLAEFDYVARRCCGNMRLCGSESLFAGFRARDGDKPRRVAAQA